MVRFVTLLFFLFAVPGLAWAQAIQTLRMEDPLARRIASTARHESGMLGPSCAQVSIFSVPEPEGKGERLYVGLVDTRHYRNSPVHVWRGPLAAGWGKLGPVPEYIPRWSAPNPARYRVVRDERAPDGSFIKMAMEIDLESKPARLKLVGGRSGQTSSQDSFILEEIAPLDESMRLLPRLHSQRVFNRAGYVLVSYGITQGQFEPTAKCLPEYQHWQTPFDSHLLLVHRTDQPEKAAAHFLPLRPGGWMLRRPVPVKAARNAERFVLEMFAEYLVPDKNGSLTLRGARHLVTAGMDGMSITTLELGYLYDVGSETWLKVDSTSTAKHAP